MRYLVPIGRLFYVVIFLMTPLSHFSKGTIGYATQAGVPFAEVLVPLSGVIAFVGALSILLGYHAKLGAWLIVLFLVPVTLSMHNFWAVADAGAAQMQQIMFIKNLSMLGCALMLTYFGSGPCSVDGSGKGR